MPQIVTRSYFNNNNGLYIPMAVEHPTSYPSQSSPNNASAIDLMCEKVERDILLNALGLATYNELQLALADINNPLYASYKKLVEGDSYDGKVWNGLNDEYSLIAYRVYELFRTSTESQTTSTGEAKVNTQNANHYSPSYKIADANQLFIKKYQGNYSQFPDISFVHGVEFIDYFGEHEEIEVSFYNYMNDKKSDFSNFNIEKFKIYTENALKNSFGL